MNRRALTVLCITFCVAVALLAGPSLAQGSSGGVHVVNTLADENDGSGQGAGRSLRDAVAEACPGDVIIFDSSLVGGTVSLTLGELSITSSLTIDGDVNGDMVSDITLDANSASRIITFNGTSGRLRLQHLTFVNGDVSGDVGNDSGGAISHRGADLEVFRCQFYDNIASSGGAIYKFAFSNPGRLTVASCRFDRNVASNGGAIHLGSDGIVQDADVIIDSCSFRDNTAGEGGAIFRNGFPSLFFTTVVTNTGFSLNDANRGGAVRFSSVPARFDRCSFAANAASSGGAFYSLHEGELLFDRCTFEFNTALSGSTQRGGALFISTLGTSKVDFRQTAIFSNSVGSIGGGGVYLDSTNNDSIRFSHCVLSLNLFSDFSGMENGWAILNDGAAFSIDHSIIGMLEPADFPYSSAISGSYTSLGYNLFTEFTVPGAVSTDIVGGLTGLSTSGAGQIEPSVPSDAIDAGDPSLVAGVGDVPLTDFFGRSRVNGTIDIGVTEFGAVPVAGPAVVSVTRLDPQSNGLRKIRFLVTFDQPVNGVFVKNFAPSTTGSIQGAVVEDVNSTGLNTYTVLVDSGIGVGTLSLDVVNDGSIVGLNTRVSLSGAGLGSGDFSTGDSYQMVERADVDSDGDVDIDDWSSIVVCFNGPDTAIPAVCGCERADIDLDGDVDLKDASIYQSQR